MWCFIVFYRILQIGLAFGLMIAICIQMVGHVSGGHMNPAVSIAMAVVFNISPLRAILYVIAQCGGGILGSLLLKGWVNEWFSPVLASHYSANNNLGLTTLDDSIATAVGIWRWADFHLVSSGCHGNLSLSHLRAWIVPSDTANFKLGPTTVDEGIVAVNGFGIKLTMIIAMAT